MDDQQHQNETADGRSDLTAVLESRIADLAEWFTDNPNKDDIIDGLRCIVRDTIFAERMACSRACAPHKFPNECDRNIAHKCADAIRMRSNG